MTNEMRDMTQKQLAELITNDPSVLTGLDQK